MGHVDVTVFAAELARVVGHVFAFISNGHGAWEAAVTNLIAAGDKVLVPSTGHFGENLLGVVGPTILLP